MNEVFQKAALPADSKRHDENRVCGESLWFSVVWLPVTPSDVLWDVRVCVVLLLKGLHNA